MQKKEFIGVIGTVQSYLAKWEKRLNFGNGVTEIARKSTRERENWISVMKLPKFLSCPSFAREWIVAIKFPKMGGGQKKKNCGNQVAKNGRKKKKKDATSITFSQQIIGG